MPVQFSLVFAKLAVLAAAGIQPAAPEFSDSPPQGATPQDGRLPALDEKQFARLRATMPDAAFSYFIYCHLLDVEFHLQEIARAQLARDFLRLSHKALTIAGMAADVGAMRAGAAARRLAAASRAGDYRETCRFISELNHRCTESETELRRFLAYRARAAGLD
jgi:hypothetical protein